MVNTLAGEIQLLNAEYALCGIDDDAEVLQMGEEETSVFLMFFCGCAGNLNVIYIHVAEVWSPEHLDETLKGLWGIA